MTDAKFNDLSENGSQVVRYDQAYKITVASFGNKTEISFDTVLDQKLGTLKDMIGLALKNKIQWEKVTWETDASTGKKKKISTPVLDDTQK